MIQYPSTHMPSRKNRNYVAFVLALLFAAILSAHAQDCEETSSQEQRQTYSVVGIAEEDTLNVRSGPGEKFSTVTKLRNGYGGIIIGGEVVWNGGDDWVPILFSNAKGWVRPKYLAPNGQPIASALTPRAIAADANDEDEDEDNTQPSQPETAPIAPRVSNNNDVLVLGLGAIVIGAIIIDEFSGGNASDSGDDGFLNRWYINQESQQKENERAASHNEPLPYPNAPRY